MQADGTRILVDGYNFLFCTGGADGNIDSRREELTELLIAYADSCAEPITLVYDASLRKGPFGNQRSHIQALEIVYTERGQSADDYIVLELEYTKVPHRCTVVTSDSGLKRRSVGHGAKVISAKSFLQKLEKWQAASQSTQSTKPTVYEEEYVKIFEHRYNQAKQK